MKATHTQAEVLAAVRAMRPGSDPVAADHDSMSCHHDPEVEPWHVFFGSEDNAPERIMLPVREPDAKTQEITNAR